MIKEEQKAKWHGYFPAVVTPFNEDGSLDMVAFRENLEQVVGAGVHGLIVTGTTGEYWALSDEERKDLYEAAADQVRGRVTVVGGATALQTEKVIEFGKHALAVGLDGIMVAPPPGALPSERELLLHYQAISDAVDIPIMIYNHRERYGVAITPELASRLADIENVVANKESTPNFAELTNTIRLAGDRLAVFAGWPQLRLIASATMGAPGHVGSIGAQIAGRAVREMWDFFHAGELDKAREIQFKLYVLQVEGMLGNGSWPAQLKAAMNMQGKPGGYPRKPILPVTDEQEKRIRDTLQKLGLL
jgi:4-hydroxy-tetrahydrodipicolinate synthase